MVDDWDEAWELQDDAPAPGQLVLLGENEEFHRAWAEWEGMPEFTHEELTPESAIVVKFRTADDRLRFGELIGQRLLRGEVPHGIWFPKLEIAHFTDYRYRDVNEGETT